MTRDVRRVTVFGFALVVMAVAGLGFAYKMAEFVTTMVHDEIAGFGAVAVATYLIGMLPIVCLTLWAVLTGRFRDIERPKFRLLELHEELERAERRRG
jgi:ABC-type uncharacterized transport system permease subunit